MVQMTVRFYDSPEDDKALEKLKDYKNYGFSSCRNMIISAINSFERGNSGSSGNDSIDLDELADKIAQRLNGTITPPPVVKKVEQKKEKEDKYAKAISFMDSL